MDTSDKITLLALIVILALCTFMIGVQWSNPEPVKPTRECERILLAVPVPDNSNQVTVTEMRVCGRDLEWFRISSNDTGDLV